MSKIFETADTKARRRFTYKLDAGDTWRSHADDVLAGKRWQGDCDDLASTTADIAIRMGANKADIWFAIVSSARNGKVDHMITIAKDETGRFWVLGDTFGPYYNIKDMKHQLIDIHNLTWPITEWQTSTIDELLING